MLEKKEISQEKQAQPKTPVTLEKQKAASSESAENESKKTEAKAKKERKPLTPKQRKRKTITVSIMVAVLCSFGGGVGGYFLYNTINPAKEPTVNVATGTDTDYKNIAKSVTEGAVMANYASKPWDIINYSCYLQATSTYSLTIGKSSAVAAGVTQNIQSATLATPEEIFNQNVSSSSFVHTACRFYDTKQGKVDCYEKSVASDWQQSGLKPTENTYDEFIQRYGKLQKGLYYCTTDTESSGVKDKYLTDSAEEYQASSESSKHEVSGVLIYSIYKSTVLLEGYSFKKNDDSTYSLEMDLNPNSGGADEYYKVQMTTTGGLSKKPVFNSSHVSFVLDSSLGLVSSVFTDSYLTSVSILSNIQTSQTMTQYYFRSTTNTFSNGVSQVDVQIPEISDIDFNGYSLWLDK